MKAKANTNERFVIIMAGGRGERFWPVSREKTPKQLLTLLGKRSFLQQAVDRVLPLVPAQEHSGHHQRGPGAGGAQATAQAAQGKCRSPNRSDATPAPRSRSARRWSARVRPPASWRCCRPITSFPRRRNFSRCSSDAFDLAGRGQAIITIGIKPTEPATGYGYIRVGETAARRRRA